MKIKGGLPELLAPAGDMECLLAAVAAGADAIYVGAKSFSARAYAKNFDIDELARAVVYCHLHGVKLYVTINTLLYDREIESAVSLARELYAIGVDALIVADLGLVRCLRRAVPELELHASTQMSVHNSLGADEAHALGCTRVVLARELSGDDIKSVTEECRPEVEIFLHGALCVCHSGQCLFSSLVGGRSGNRGECAQPCRLPYNGGKYPISLSDLSLSRHIPKLIEAGVASLKIEGRMKSPSYVYTVTSIYRRLLDERRGSTPLEERELARAFSRGEFTDAYFRGHPEDRMTGVRTNDEKAESKAAEIAEFKPIRLKMSAKVSIKREKPSELTLKLEDGREARATADVPNEAINAPLTAEAVAARVAKMGNTFFELSPLDVAVDLDPGLNLSPAALNALRRSAVSILEGERREVSDVELPERLSGAPRSTGKKHRTAIFYSREAYMALGDSVRAVDIDFLPLWRITDSASVRMPSGVAMPPVVMESELSEVRRMLSAARDGGVRYALVGNLGHIALAREFGLIPIGDFRFNIMNGYARDAIVALGVDDPMLSPELTAREAASVGGREIVYGRIPLMLTERCFMRDLFGCRRCGEDGLRDRRGVEFPAVREFEHRNLVFNSAVTYVADKPAELSLFDREHYIFTDESAGEIKRTLQAYKTGAPAPKEMQLRRIGRREVKK